jgi:hypothetical protein
VTRPHGDHTYDGHALAVCGIREKCRAAEAGLAMHVSARATRVMSAFSAFARAWFAQRGT